MNDLTNQPGQPVLLHAPPLLHVPGVNKNGTPVFFSSLGKQKGWHLVIDSYGHQMVPIHQCQLDYLTERGGGGLGGGGQGSVCHHTDVK